jgi:hypothetical protein
MNSPIDRSSRSSLNALSTTSGSSTATITANTTNTTKRSRKPKPPGWNQIAYMDSTTYLSGNGGPEIEESRVKRINQNFEEKEYQIGGLGFGEPLKLDFGEDFGESEFESPSLLNFLSPSTSENGSSFNSTSNQTTSLPSSSSPPSFHFPPPSHPLPQLPQPHHQSSTKRHSPPHLDIASTFSSLLDDPLTAETLHLDPQCYLVTPTAANSSLKELTIPTLETEDDEVPPPLPPKEFPVAFGLGAKSPLGKLKRMKSENRKGGERGLGLDEELMGLELGDKVEGSTSGEFCFAASSFSERVGRRL